jgi:hypothetical protein
MDTCRYDSPHEFFEGLKYSLLLAEIVQLYLLVEDDVIAKVDSVIGPKLIDPTGIVPAFLEQLIALTEFAVETRYEGSFTDFDLGFVHM